MLTSVFSQEHDIHRRHHTKSFIFVRKYALLTLVLFIQAVASLSLHNTAFQDEAMYLDAGRRILSALSGGEHVDVPFINYFSGFPYFYPVIGGVLDLAGGLEAARLFSLVCMLATTVAVYSIGQTLFNRQSAILGAATFSAQGSVLFLSNFATFDALCLLLVAASTLLALRFGASPSPWGALAVGGLLLLACIAKYAALLFLPSVLLVFGWTVWAAYGWKQTGLRIGIALLLPLTGLLSLLLCVPGLDEGMGITTLHRQAMFPASRAYLLREAVSLDGVLFLLAAIGFLRDVHPRRRLLLLGFLLTSLLAPLYHIDKLEETSFHKHIAYGEFFLAPLAGCALARFCGYKAVRSTRGFLRQGKNLISWSPVLALVTCAALFYIGLGQARDLFGSWLDCSALITEAQTSVRPTDKILAQNVEVTRYYLRNVPEARQWNDLTWFNYADPGGASLSGRKAYQAAIKKGYFDVIIFTGEAEAPSKGELADELEAQVRGSSRYYLEAQVPCSGGFETDMIHIWRKVDAAKSASAPKNSLHLTDGFTKKVFGRKEGLNAVSMRSV